MRRIFAIVSLMSAWAAGCQLISGVNDLEVVDDATGGTGGSGGSGGAGGAAGADGSGGSGGTGGATSAGGTGGVTSSGGTGGVTSAGGTGGQCSDQPGWECDIMTQCGCSATENCAYDVDQNGTVCGPIGTVEPYHVCDVNTDCPRGYGCIGEICKKHCTRASDCGWEEASCLEVYDDEVVIEGFGFCSEECNPIHPTVPRQDGVACDDHSTCYAYTDDEGNLEHTVCSGTDGEGVQGDPCATDDGDPDPYACAPGYRCSNASKTCRRYCEIGASDCDEEDTCVGFEPPAYLDDYELGSCFTCETGNFECSVYPECGCDAGDACKITDLETGATECLPAGTVPAWGSCSDQADCAPSAGACVSGFCHPFCEEPGGDSCVIGDCLQAVATATETPVPGLYYCALPCEPVLTDRGSAMNALPCAEGSVCIPVREDPVDVATSAFCAPSDGVGEGGYCDANSDCSDGYGCLDNVCAPYCRGDADCSEIYPTCFTVTPPLYAAPGDEIGQCSVE